MKKIVFITALMFLLIPVLSFGANLNLRATWTANTETDMKDYQLFRTDAGRTLIGTIAHPTTTYNFTIVVPDGSQGILTFVLTARDTNNNESVDSSPASYAYNLDTTPPSGPKNLSVQPQ